MRYDDASQSVSTGHSEPVARPDVDILPAGSFGPATGNAITGQGTNSGASGADSVSGSPAITQVQGAGGQTVVDNGNFQAPGQYGVLQMDAQGNFNYVRNPNTPDGVKDVFNYTVADATGGAASTTLTIDIAQVAAAAAGQGVVALPAGVELSDIHVNGRDLVINMPDGTQMVIPNGAVFVPEITIGDVQVPPTNIAALLVDSEPQPAAGPPTSSGGDWNDPVPPLDPGVPLGDLIPPTELSHTPPDFVEPGGFIHQPPTLVIETPDFPAGVVDASESVNEKGLPARDGDLPNEPAGSGEIADGNGLNNSDPSETNTGTIVFTAKDGFDNITVNGTAITQVGQTIQGQYGTMTITSIDLANGQIGYSYTLADNTSGDNTADHFTVIVTDKDGDQATGTLTVNIIDDVPTARNDTDTTDNVSHVATGNVMTGEGTTSGAAGADTVGADNATLTAVSGAGGSDNSFDASGHLVVAGQYGTLTISADGSYTYTLNANAPGGSVDTFTYTLTDGDGDTSTATLTINNPDHIPTIVIETPDNPAGAVNASESVFEKGLPERNGEPAGSGEIADGNGTNNSDPSETNTGTIVFNAQDGVKNVTVDGTVIDHVGQTIQGQYGVMTITSIDLATGQIGYSYTLSDNTSGNNTADHFTVVVTDTDGDTAQATLTVNIVDDVPTARNDTDVTDDQTHTATGNVVTGADTTSGVAGADTVGADNAHVTAISGAGGTDNTADGSGNYTVAGNYGTLVINADGTYTYTENQGAPGGSTDVFTYTLTDGDGDTSTATLTITNPDHTPTVLIQTPDHDPTANAQESVFEKGLPARGSEPAGSGEIADGNPNNNSDTSETNTGTILINSQDGIQSVTVNGTVVDHVGETIQGQYGVMTITSINLATGQIGYSYTLSDNTSGDNTHDDFSVVVTDSDGDHASATLTVNIVDDVPTAHNDTDSTDLVTNVADGNVITGAGTDGGTSGPGVDVVGADNAHLTAIASNNVPANSDSTADGSGNYQVAGEFGTLTINQDGSYTYTENQGAPGGSVDVFTYTLTDGDGDTSTATLTITNPDHVPTTGPNALVIVDDDDVVGANGNPGGVGDLDPQNTTGTLSGSGGDGALTFALTANGAPAGFSYSLQSNGDLWVMQGATHVLTITVNSATGAYSVTEVAPIEHPAGSNENNVNFDVTYTVTDSDGDHANGTLSIEVNDDTPLANPDSDTIAAGSYGPATGNVITGVGTNEGTANHDSPGADGFGGVTMIASDNVPANTDSTADGSGNYVVHGQYGTLTINEDGSYSYARDAGTPGGVSDVFTYTYQDGDGDTVSSTLTINIGDATPSTGENALVIVDDDDVVGANGNPGGVGDLAPQNTSGTLSGSGGDAPIAFALTANGAPAGFTYSLQSNGDLWVMQGATHVLTVTVNSATGAYTVTEVAPIDHPAGGNENNVSFDITYTVTDVDGDHANGTLSIEVNDDTPLANNDSDNIASGSNGPATGNVITGVGTNEGAANHDSPGADGFGGLVSIASNNVPANTDNTADGSGNFVVAGQYGTLTINEDGSYSYARNPGEGGGQSDVFTYTYQDGDGDTVSATLTINIADSVPTTGPNALVIVDDDDVVGANGNPGGVGDLAPQNTSGTLSGSGGDAPIAFALTANGAPAGFTYSLQSNGDLWVMQGATHVLTVTVNSATGAYTVTEVAPIDHPAGGNENNVNFNITYTVTDNDGDHANGTLSIEVNDDTPLANNDSDNIAAGTYGPATGNVITGVGTNEGTANHDSPGADGFGGVTMIASNNVPANTDNTADGSGNYVVAGQYGTLTINQDGDYSYTRNPGTSGGVSDVFTYTYKDGDGDTVSATLTINIGDATPSTGPNAQVIVDDDDVSGTVGNPGGTGDLAPQNTSGTLAGSGGDAPIAFALLATGAPAGFSYSLQSNGDLWVMQGAVHVLTVTVNSSTGAYTVTEVHTIDHPAGSDENNVNFTINYQVTDTDGDTATGTLAIEVNDDTPVNFTPVSHTDTTGATATTLDDALVNNGSASVTSFINDSNSNPANGENFIGADGFAAAAGLVFTGTASQNGTPLLDAHGHALTSHGHAILVTGYGTDTLIAYVESGANTGYQAGQDTLVFTATLNEGSGYGANSTYTINFSDTIDNGSGVQFNSVAATKAGTIAIYGLGADTTGNPDVDVMMSASNNGTQQNVNTDASSIGIGNQSFNPNDSMRIDFVQHLTTDASNATDGFDYTARVETTGFQQKVPQVVGNPTTVSFKVWALESTDTDTNFPDSNPAGGFTNSPTVTITEVWVAGHTAGEPQIAPVDISGLAVGATEAIAYGISVTRNADGSITFSGVEQGDTYGIGTGSNTFNAVDVMDVTGKFDLGIFALTTTNLGNPVDLSLGVTATDHDGDTSTGTINLTLVPDSTPQQNAVINNAAQTMSASTVSTTHLVSSNDNDHSLHSDHRAFAQGNVAAVMAALAAAGLEAEHGKLDLHALKMGSAAHSPVATPLQAAAAPAATVEPTHIVAPAHVAQPLVASATVQAPHSTAHFNETVAAHTLGAFEHGHAPSMSPLLHGTAASVHAAAAHGPVMAPAVAMPSAQQLMAALGGHSQPRASVAADGAQHNQVVSKVLADALHGGEGHGPSIDTLLHGHAPNVNHAAHDVIEALASHAGSAVPFSNTSLAAAFHGTHGMFSMGMAHHDAPPAHG